MPAPLTEVAMRLFTPSPKGKSELVPPDGNETHFYVVSRLMSFWPTINGNNATFFEEDCGPVFDQTATDAARTTPVGRLVNTWHKKGPATGNSIIGSIYDAKHVSGQGIDIIAEIDRKAASTYEITPNDFRSGAEYSAVSQEVFCDRSKSRFIVMVNPLSPKLDDQRVYTAEEAEQNGIRRTSVVDPDGAYYHDGRYTVVEACYPIRWTGAGYLDSPADPTAQTFLVAASLEAGITPSTQENIMTPEEIAKKIADAVATEANPLKLELAELKAQRLEVENSASKAKEEQAANLVALNAQVAELKEILATRDTEIATLKTSIAERDSAATAETRLNDLKTVEGFEVKEDEKAALIAALAKETDEQFTIRKQGAEIAALRKGVTAKSKATENAGKSDEEVAALQRLAGDATKASSMVNSLFEVIQK